MLWKVMNRIEDVTYNNNMKHEYEFLKNRKVKCKSGMNHKNRNITNDIDQVMMQKTRHLNISFL